MARTGADRLFGRRPSPQHPEAARAGFHDVAHGFTFPDLLQDVDLLDAMRWAARPASDLATRYHGVSMSLLLLILVLSGVSAFVYQAWLRPDQRITRALGAAPVTSVADTQGGVRKLTGQLRMAGDSLTAPLSGRSCAAYVLAVDEYRFLGGWTPLLREKRAVGFRLADDTGEAAVEPDEHCELAISNTVEGRSSPRRMHPGLIGHLRRLGFATETRLGFSKRLRFEEGALVSGCWVSVGGLAGWEPSPAGEREGYRALPGRLVVRGTPQFPVFISDEVGAYGPALAPPPSPAHALGAGGRGGREDGPN
jgi:hypothetical protein